MWKETELSYLAGLIDGEGSIYIQARERKKLHYVWIDYFPRFQIVNTNKRLMNWVHQKFGGLIYEKPRKHHNPKWKMQIEWFTTRGLMDQLLPLILPYLIIKKPHCEIMIEFRKTFSKTNNKKVSEDIQKFRLECHIKIRHLNQIPI